MDILECYKDKTVAIQTAVDSARNALLETIENDKDYALADDEAIELVDDLIIMYMEELIKNR